MRHRLNGQITIIWYCQILKFQIPDFNGLNLVSNEYETIWVHRNRDLVKSDFSVNSKYLLLGRNLKIWSSKSRKIIKFCPLKNFRLKVFSPWIWWFFDFLGSIYSGFDRVRNILSSQKNQVLRDLFSHQLKISHTRSKPNLNRKSPFLRTLIFGSLI